MNEENLACGGTPTVEAAKDDYLEFRIENGQKQVPAVPNQQLLGENGRK